MKLYKTHSNERGSISGAQVTIIGLAVLVLGLGSFGIWAFVSYSDAKDNVDTRVATARTEERQATQEEDEKKFAEREKAPYKQFVGPVDYCRVTFDYPKTWSSYVNKDVANGGDYEAYFHRDVVPPVSSDQQFALRFTIEQKQLDKVLDSYQGLVTKGDLRSSTSSSDGNDFTRLTGNFSKKIRGDAVLFKCNDKTVTIRTDADVFKPEFEDLIKTIRQKN
ncbi:TPA: hypothetical protein DDX46_04855 [Candidatus Saccharibacteria bacterium]|nr:MAG: exported protein of unknown function [Candidatus Saccharibacteria bacterium GW2011_GWC2_44_17]MBH1956530.1 hypothetical protein [Candidatus Saccharibacteria bacterium]OGL23111.1 MAG: hypothetical protein A2791_05540 [Candidatus Saccharibacteria bacterium RIFCSPHIGHO2_01_FULL_46_30]OGL34148.1 MAG: hypothetical protein A3E20_04575 [Candidatus Saccharibacteria bacterium RIFCSPHIGHO2_12_FULL_47_16]MBH1972918.1 hypothetical protein [Candidatus Saccharibacteria bacterium]